MHAHRHDDSRARFFDQFAASTDAWLAARGDSTKSQCVDESARRAMLPLTSGLVHPLAAKFDWTWTHRVRGRVALLGDSVNSQFFDALVCMCTAAGGARCNLTFVKKDVQTLPSRSKESEAAFDSVLFRFLEPRLSPLWNDVLAPVSEPRPFGLILANFGAWYNGGQLEATLASVAASGGEQRVQHGDAGHVLPFPANGALLDAYNYSLRKRDWVGACTRGSACNVDGVVKGYHRAPAGWAPSEEVYRRDLHSFAAFVTHHRGGKGQLRLPPIAWRPTFPQHFPSRGGVYDAKKHSRRREGCAPLSSNATARAAGEWRNALARSVLSSYGIPVLSGLVGPSTLGAWSSHVVKPDGTHDCTHWCAPSGVTEYWAVYTMNWMAAWARGETLP